MRYVSTGYEQAFAVSTVKNMLILPGIWFISPATSNDFLSTHEPKLPSQHVFGKSVEDIYQTLLFAVIIMPSWKTPSFN